MGILKHQAFKYVRLLSRQFLKQVGTVEPQVFALKILAEIVKLKFLNCWGH